MREGQGVPARFSKFSYQGRSTRRNMFSQLHSLRQKTPPKKGLGSQHRKSWGGGGAGDARCT